MRWSHVRFLFAWSFAMIAGCAAPSRVPAPIEIDGVQLTLSTAGVTERLDFIKGERRVQGQVTLLVDPMDAQADHFSPPRPRLISIQDECGREYLTEHDTMRLDVKISAAMRGERKNPADHSGGNGRYSFGFELEEPLDQLALIEGELETSRATAFDQIEVSLATLAESYEIAERCHVRANTSPKKNGEILITINVDLAVTEASRDAPNAPIRIDVLADDGTILGSMKSDSMISRSGQIVQRSTFTTALPDGRELGALVFHVVRAVEWDSLPFRFRNVPLRGELPQ